MPTPLEKYLSGLAAPSYLNSAFAVGSDNVGSDLLKRGIEGFKLAMPQTLAAYLLKINSAWSQDLNDQRVDRMLSNTNMKAVHIYHQAVCAAIKASHGDTGVVSEDGFAAAFRGNVTSPTLKEIKKIIASGFVNVESSKDDYAMLTRN